MQRRDFLVGLAGASGLSGEGQGEVLHLLPTASDQRMLLKASFAGAHAKAPRLEVGKRRVAGSRGDSAGRYWAFDVSGLEPDTPYRLTLTDASGRALCTPWTLKTLPEPGAMPKQVRLLVYTCAGGHDAVVDDTGQPRALSLARRQRLLRRALSFRPDAVIANGDHVYWDLLSKPGVRWGASAAAERYAGRFDRRLPVLGTVNEGVLVRAAAPQVASLYGTMCRGVPMFFVSDDHDYFENDDADDRLVTFPPDHFMLGLARATRRLLYPEFLPDANRPAGLLGASAADVPTGCAEAYGTLRFGKLVEVLMYDCRRSLTLHGPSSVFVARDAEEWLTQRMAQSDAAHVINVPSTPPGWTAGKWGCGTRTCWATTAG